MCFVEFSVKEVDNVIFCTFETIGTGVVFCYMRFGQCLSLFETFSVGGGFPFCRCHWCVVCCVAVICCNAIVCV